jgi:hypothetical protein
MWLSPLLDLCQYYHTLQRLKGGGGDAPPNSLFILEIHTLLKLFSQLRTVLTPNIVNLPLCRPGRINNASESFGSLASSLV